MYYAKYAFPMRGVLVGVDVGASFFASALDSYKPHLQSLSNLKLYLKRLGCILNQFPDNTNGMKTPPAAPTPHFPAVSLPFHTFIKMFQLLF